MDPSEFEGTLENNALEGNFQETMVFAPVDLNKSAGDIYQSIYDLQQLIQKSASRLSTEEFLNEMEQFTLKITEMKDEHVHRRTNLRKFVKQYLSKLEVSEDVSPEFRVASTEIVDIFKREYDHVSSFAKFIEQGYLSIYNEVHDIPGYAEILQKTFKHCLQLQDLFKQAQEQFVIAEQLLSTFNSQKTLQSKANLQSSSLLANILQPLQSPTDFSAEQQQIIAEEKQKAVQEKEQELKEFYCLEMLNQQKQYEQERRMLESVIGQQYENKILILEQSYEKIIHSKELEIVLLTNEIAQWNTKKQLFEESRQTLRQEQEKKSIVEEKLHQQILQNHELSQQILHFEKELGDSKQLNELLMVQVNDKTAKYETTHQQLQQQLQSLQQHANLQEEKLATLPNPLLMYDFLMKIEFFHANNIASDSASSSALHDPVPWITCEQYIVDTFRKINQDIISLRIENDRLHHTKQQMEEQLTDIQKKYEQLLTHSEPPYSHSPSTLLGREMKLGVDEFDLENILNSETVVSEKEHESFFSKSFTVTADSSNSTTSNHQEKTQQKILQMIQQQRQHYQTASQQLQEEKKTFEQQIASQSHEMIQLRTENVELYRRLRVLRMSNHSNNPAGDISINIERQQHGKHRRQQVMLSNYSVDAMDTEDPSRSRSGMGGGGGGGNTMDGLDQKYAQLYEQQELNPFKILAYEKQQYFYNMHWMDRLLAWLYTTVLQDPWARYAFLVYLLLLNFCALLYVFQVINPSLIEEVDARMKEKWSTQTLSLPEHPDVA